MLPSVVREPYACKMPHFFILVTIRIFVFVSQTALTHLAQSWQLVLAWYILCGTYTIPASVYYHVPLGESAVSCVYIFLPNKLQGTYEELLIAVASKCSETVIQPDLQQLSQIKRELPSMQYLLCLDCTPDHKDAFTILFRSNRER